MNFPSRTRDPEVKNEARRFIRSLYAANRICRAGRFAASGHDESPEIYQYSVMLQINVCHVAATRCDITE